MKNSVSALGLLLATALLAACQTGPQGSGVQQGVTVTRFHTGEPIARGEIRIEPSDPAAASGLEFSQQAAAVARELSRLGWRLVPDNARSEQVALVTVTQGARYGMRPASGISVGVGGASGSYGGGVAGGVSADVPVGGGEYEVIVTELAVRIQRRSDASVVWEGRAQMEARAGSALGSPGPAIDRLAQALFQDFPGESGRTIRAR